MTKPSMPPLVTWNLRTRFKMWVPTANTGGSFYVCVATINTSSRLVAPAIDAAKIDLDLYQANKNKWHDIEVYFKPTNFALDAPLVGMIEINHLDQITGGEVLISELFIDEVGSTPGVPQQVPPAGTYVLRITDNGKHIYIASGGVTIPNNSDQPIPVEFIGTIVNNSGSAQSIGKGGSVTMYKAGDSVAKTTLSLAARGLATCLKVGTDTWMVSGNVT